MRDDFANILLTKVDNIISQQNIMNERLARVETKLEEKERRCTIQDSSIDALWKTVNVLKEKVGELDSKESVWEGARGTALWIATTVIAAYAAFK